MKIGCLLHEKSFVKTESVETVRIYVVPSLGHHHEREVTQTVSAASMSSRGHQANQQRSLDEQEQKLQERLQYERYLHEKHEQERAKLEKERVERDRSKRREAAAAAALASSEGQKRPPSRQHRQQQPQTDKHEQDKDTR